MDSSNDVSSGQVSSGTWDMRTDSIILVMEPFTLTMYWNDFHSSGRSSSAARCAASGMSSSQALSSWMPPVRYISLVVYLTTIAWVGSLGHATGRGCISGLLNGTSIELMT
jgi:hypothetical protein